MHQFKELSLEIMLLIYEYFINYYLDVNECIDTTLCDQICANEEGSYGCKCETGFRLQADGRTCAGRTLTLGKTHN